MFQQVIVTLTILALTRTEAKRSLIYGASFAECTHKAPHLITSYECHLKNEKSRIYGYGHIIFKRRIEAMDLQVNIVRNEKGIGDINIINLKLDLCNFLAATQKQRYLDFLVKPLRKYVNEIPRCPLKENFNYTIADAFLDAENFPAFIPAGNFSFIASFYDRKKEAGYFKLMGQVLHKEKKRKPSDQKA